MKKWPVIINLMLNLKKGAVIIKLALSKEKAPVIIKFPAWTPTLQTSLIVYILR